MWGKDLFQMVESRNSGKIQNNQQKLQSGTTRKSHTMQEEAPAAPAQIMTSAMRLPQNFLHCWLVSRGRATCCNLLGETLSEIDHQTHKNEKRHPHIYIMSDSWLGNKSMQTSQFLKNLEIRPSCSSLDGLHTNPWILMWNGACWLLAFFRQWKKSSFGSCIETAAFTFQNQRAEAGGWAFKKLALEKLKGN